MSGKTAAMAAWLALALLSPTLSARGQNTTDAAPFSPLSDKVEDGGWLHVYMNTSGAVKQFTDRLRAYLESPQAWPGANALIDIRHLEAAVTALGLHEIRDVAFAAKDVDDWRYKRRYVRFTSPEARLRRLFGGSPHIFETMRYAPQDTLFYLSMDCDLNAAYTLARDTIAALEADDLTQALTALHDGLYEQTGFAFSTLAAAVGPEVALIVDRDTEKELTEGVPLPRFALVAATRNDTPYRMILSYLERSDTPHDVSAENRIRRVQVRLPQEAMPEDYPLAPAIGFDGRFLVIATQPDYLDKLLATGDSYTNLASADEYLKIRQGMPAQGNGQMFISARLGEIFLTPTIEMLGVDLPLSISGAISMRVNDPDGSLLIQKSPKDGGMSFWSALINAPIMGLRMMPMGPAMMMGDPSMEFEMEFQDFDIEGMELDEAEFQELFQQMNIPTN